MGFILENVDLGFFQKKKKKGRRKVDVVLIKRKVSFK
jgi:hypothetical protein